MIQVISLRGRGGVRPAGVYVGRPSALGNPFLVGRDGTREDVIARYRRWLRAQWRHGGAVRQELERLAAQYRRDGQLTLLCWCAPLPCHADVIREAVLALVRRSVMVRVLITGSREASPAMLAKVEEVVLWVKREGYALLVGDAPGVDAHVRVCAEALSVPTTVYGAYGRLRGRRRSHEQVVVVPEDYRVRDRLMAQRCDLCVAVWNGRSRGTKDTFEYTRQLGKRVLVRAFDAAGGR